MSIETPEEWQWIPGFERRYQVSNLGRVRSFQRPGGPRLLKIQYWSSRVALIHLGEIGGYWTIGSLVLTAFEGSRPTKKHMALHKDLNWRNNLLSNLYWGDSTDVLHRDRVQRARTTKGSHGSRIDLRPHLVTIRRRLLHETSAAIARDFNVNESTINRIKNGKRHAHI